MELNARPTTSGFGDITPQTGLARMIVSIEAATGQIFLAVVIAWLVGKVSRSQASATPSESEFSVRLVTSPAAPR